MPLMVFFVSAARTGKLPSCSHATSDGKKNLPAVLDGAKNSSVLPWKTIGTQEPTWKIGWIFLKLHVFFCLMRSGPCFHDFPRRIPRLAVHGRLKATSASQSGVCRTAMGWGRILHLVVGFFLLELLQLYIYDHIWSYMYIFVYRIDDDNDDDIMVYIYIYERERERSKQQWWGKIEKFMRHTRFSSP